MPTRQKIKSLVCRLFLVFSLVLGGEVHAKINVLVGVEIEDAANARANIGTYALHYFLPMEKMVSDDIRVFEADSYTFMQEKDKLSRYDVIILWNLPRKIYKETIGPELGWRTVVSEDMCKDIMEFVKNGGGLIIAGPDYLFKDKAHVSFSGYLKYSQHFAYGYKESVLDPIIPIEHLIKYTNDKNKIESFQIKKGAFEIPVIWAPFKGEEFKRSGETKPMISGLEFGKGRVLALKWAWRQYPYATGGIAWNKEGIVFDRAIKWAGQKEDLILPEQEEKKLINNYDQLTSPPKELPPLEWIEEEYPFILWSNIWVSKTPLSARYFKDLGFNKLSFQYAHDVPAGVNCTKIAADYGFQVYPHVSVYAFLVLLKSLQNDKSLPEEEWRGIFQDGTVISERANNPWPCPHSPYTVEHSKKALQGFVKAYKTNNIPNIKGYFLDDEETWRFPFNNVTTGRIGCFCKHCNAFYKKKTGRDVPPPEYKTPGYIYPKDDPWIEWVNIVRNRGFLDYGQAMCQAIREVHPGALMGYLGGGFWGEADIIIDEHYINMHKENMAIAMEHPDIGFARRDDLEGEKTPYYTEIFLTKGRGCGIGTRGTALAPEQFRLISGLALSRGLRGLILWEPEYVYDYSEYGKPLDREIKILGGLLHKYGPMFLKLKRTIPPVWVLGAWFHCNSFEHSLFLAPKIGEAKDPQRAWYRQHCMNIAWPAIVRAQVPAAAVTERQLVSKDLFKQQAVIIPALEYCTQEIVDNLKEFIKKGGLVYLDESSSVKIEGANILPCRFDHWHQTICRGERLTGYTSGNISDDDISRDDLSYARQEDYIRDLIPVIKKEITEKIDPEIRVESNKDFYNGVHSLMKNGDAEYLFIANLDLKFGRIMEVIFKNNPGIIYDILEGGQIEVKQNKESKFTFTTQLPAGGWGVYLLSKKKIGDIAVVKSTLKDNILKLEVEIKDAGGNLFKAAVPLEIKIIAQNREAVLYRSTDKGRGTFEIPLENYLKEVSKAEVKELIGGKQTESFVK